MKDNHHNLFELQLIHASINFVILIHILRLSQSKRNDSEHVLHSHAALILSAIVPRKLLLQLHLMDYTVEYGCKNQNSWQSTR